MIALRHKTLGRSPLDEWPDRYRDLYLTTHNTSKRPGSMPLQGFEPTIPERRRPETHAWRRRVNATMRIKLSCCPLYQDLKNLNDDQKNWAKMEMLGIMRKAKNMVFQPQYAQCFTATTSLPQTYGYNLQYQNTSTVWNMPNKRTVNFPSVLDALSSKSSDSLGIC